MKPPRFFRFPFLYQDAIIFVNGSRVALVPTHGGLARALCFFPEPIIDMVGSNDGSTAVVATIGRSWMTLWLVEIESGSKEPFLEVEPGCSLIGWLEDTAEVVIRSASGVNVWAASTRNQLVSQLPYYGLNRLRRFANGSILLGTGLVAPHTWRGYSGGDRGRVWVGKDQEHLEEVRSTANLVAPAWLGSNLFALSGTRVGVGIDCLGPHRQATVVAPTLFPPPRWLTSDGDRAVYCVGGETYMLSRGSQRPIPVSVTLPAEWHPLHGSWSRSISSDDLVNRCWDYVTSGSWMGSKALPESVRDAAAEVLLRSSTSEEWQETLSEMLGVAGVSHLGITSRGFYEMDACCDSTEAQLDIPRYVLSDRRSNSIGLKYLTDGVAYLILPDTSADSLRRCQRALSEMARSDSLLLDLRGNEGGGYSFRIAQALAERWGLEAVGDPPHGYLLLVCDRRTGSGGEMLALLLRWWCGARIVGWSTGGAGSGFRKTISIDDEWSLTIPEFLFVDEAGRPLFENVGLEPDYPLPSKTAFKDDTESVLVAGLKKLRAEQRSRTVGGLPNERKVPFLKSSKGYHRVRI